MTTRELQLLRLRSLGVSLFVSGLLTGCPLAHEASNPYRCFKDKDCFTGEGEYCHRPPNAGASGAAGDCRKRADAGVTDTSRPGRADASAAPDARLPVDSRAREMRVDAQLLDGGIGDGAARDHSVASD